jgi:glutathione synthase/RimK-type ligase-like ATP-grasp enzyme
MTTRIYPYRQGSSGARALAAALGGLVLRREGSRYRPRSGDRIINWGAADMPLSLMALSPINHPGCVKDARDKLRTLNLLRAGGVPTVEWTTNKADAEAWLRDGAVFVRHSLTGQGGSGIEVVPPEHDWLPDAPLYTKLFRARHEYRVHVVGCATFVVKKRRRAGAERNVVRNHANGYVYCTNNVVPHPNVLDVGIRAVYALGLKFGAVDVLCTDGGEARVLEINTAPGLEGRTIEFYRDSIAQIIGKEV